MDKKHIFNTDSINAIPISEVAAEFSQLKRKGCHMVALCPWHTDHNPSLVLYEGTNQNFCKCYACGHGGSVISYTIQALKFAENANGFKEACHWLCNKFGIALLDGSQSKTAIQVTKVTPRQEPAIAYVPSDVMQRTITLNNPLSQCLEYLFGRDIAHRLTQKYRLGLYIDRNYNQNTIFWSIDEEGRVHNGKVQRYCTNPSSPDFAHSDKICKAYWLTHEPILSRITPEGHKLDCGGLYGIHLLNEHPADTKIIIVESPKNAIFGAAAFPEFIWLATGNKTTLTSVSCRKLEGRKGKIYPDRDAVEDWKELVAGITELRGFEISDFCEKQAPKEDEKYDIADYIVHELLSQKNQNEQ